MPKIIEKNPKVLGGLPVIRGTRVPLSRIAALLGMEYNITDIKKEYPQLSNISRTDLIEAVNYLKNQLAY